MILRDQTDALCLALEIQKSGGQRLRVEPFDPFNTRQKVGAAGCIRLDMMVQGINKSVGASGQKKH